jgi:hypothetical protein
MVGPDQGQTDEQRQRYGDEQISRQMQRPPQELVDLVEEQTPTGGGGQQ